MTTTEFDLRPQLECNAILLALLIEKINAAHDSLTPHEFCRMRDAVDRALAANREIAGMMPMRFVSVA